MFSSFPLMSMNFVYIVGIFAVSSFELAFLNITFIFEIPFVLASYMLLHGLFGGEIMVVGVHTLGLPISCVEAKWSSMSDFFFLLSPHKLTNYNLPFSPYRLTDHIIVCTRKYLLTRGTCNHIRGRDIGEDRSGPRCKGLPCLLWGIASCSYSSPLQELLNKLFEYLSTDLCQILL